MPPPGVIRMHERARTSQLQSAMPWTQANEQVERRRLEFHPSGVGEEGELTSQLTPQVVRKWPWGSHPSGVGDEGVGGGGMQLEQHSPVGD